MSTDVTAPVCEVCGKWSALFNCHHCKAMMCQPCTHFVTLYTYHIDISFVPSSGDLAPFPETIEKKNCLLCHNCYKRFGSTIHEHRFGPRTPVLDDIKREPAKGKVHDWEKLIGFKRETVPGTLPPLSSMSRWLEPGWIGERKPKKKPARRGKKRVAVDPLLQMAMEDDDG